MLEKVSIITVLYNPDIKKLKLNINSYINQTNLIVMVNNSTDIHIQKEVLHIFKNYSNIHIINLGNNYGIAKAQNIGFKYAIKQGYKYFLEMDQDSKLPNGYVSTIYNTYLKLKTKEKHIAGIGPIAINEEDQSMYHNRNLLKSVYDVEETLSSGFLITSEVLNIIGYKDEDLFIDLVDWEWCWRARSKGFKVFVDTTLNIQHVLGEGHRDFYFFKLGIPSPIRHYYQYRNSLLLSVRDYVPFKWKIKRLLIHIIKPIFFLFFYDKKLQRLKFLCRGIIDGLLGKKGIFK